MKTLAKIKQDKMVAGICSGFAYSFGVPAWIVRIAAILLICATGGAAVLVYALLWIFMPQWHVDPQDYVERTRIQPQTPAV